MLQNKIIIIVILALISTSSWGSEETKTSTVNSQKSRRVKLKFDDELVTGATEKPDVSSLNTKTDFNYKKLIRVRENFVNEMEDGLNDFKGN